VIEDASLNSPVVFSSMSIEPAKNATQNEVFISHKNEQSEL